MDTFANQPMCCVCPLQMYPKHDLFVETVPLAGPLRGVRGETGTNFDCDKGEKKSKWGFDLILVFFLFHLFIALL